MAERVRTPCYMGIDTGTYETKGVLLDAGGAVIAQAAAAHAPESPRPGYFECDAEEVFWEDLCRVSRRLLETAGVSAEDVSVLGISAMGPDVICVDGDGRPLRKAILYGVDSRASEEIAWLNGYYGEERASELYGHRICSDDGAPKILWIERHEPEVYAKARYFLTGTSFLCAKLTGRYVIDAFLAQADFRPLYDGAGQISGECRLYCREDQLAPARPAHSIAGTITPGAAARTGLSTKTRVITGTGDSTAESISCGIVKPGNLMIQLGSTMFLYYCSDRDVRSEKIHGGSFVVPGTYKLSAGTNAAGALTRYIRDRFYTDLVEEERAGGEDAFRRMAELGGRVPAGSEGLLMLPYLAGERDPIHDPDAVGMLFGLTLRHTRDHIYRAGLEAVAYSAKQILACIEELGLPIGTIMVVGGGSRNALWLQILSDVLDRPVHTPAVSLGACYGGALLAMLADGALRDYDELAERIARGGTWLPDGERAALYARYFEIYRGLYPKTCELMHRLRGAGDR